MDSKKKKKVLVESAEFRLSDGTQIVWSLTGEGYTLYKQLCSSRYVRTKRLPTFINLLWLAKTYPCKPLKSS